MEEEGKIRVIIADDHDVYRDGLRMLLSRDPLIDIVGEAANGEVLLAMVASLRTDIVLTDLRMPVMDGVEAICEIGLSFPSVRSIALSTFDSEHLIVDALEAGALGYVIKNAQKGEIIEAVKTVNSGSPYYCESTSKQLVRMISQSRFNPYKEKQRAMFSDKEQQIIQLICEERTNRVIGETLYMSTRTVEGLRGKILEKMNVKTSAGIAIYAIKNALYQIK
jgi:two-component system response regulator NreC